MKKDNTDYFEKNTNDEENIANAWKTAKDMLGITKNLSPTTVNVNGDNVTNPSKLANIFNQFFIQKVKDLRQKTGSNTTIDPVQRLRTWLEPRGELPVFQIKPIDLRVLRRILKRMKGKRSHGIDGIDSFSLKLAGPFIEDALLHLINLSFSSKTFSEQWKPQLIFPLHKKGVKHDVKNFRPVSHLVEVGKMAEYAVYEQVVTHFTMHKLFHDNHHGGLSGHSTATALIQLVDMWLEASDVTQLSATLLLDQSAAYDLVDHQILLEKLKAYNFDESAVHWFQSYLSNRSQLVQVESKQSELCQLDDHAVPQGSILGGLMFIIFSNDFPASTTEGESVMFVDDDSEVVQDSDPEALQRKIQIEAVNSANWLEDNRMCVAGDKSKLLVMGTRQLRSMKLTQDMAIQVDGKVVHETRSEKLLGVIINNELTWKEHLHGEKWRQDNLNTPGLIPQLSQRLGILRKLSRIVSKRRLKLFAEGIFYSKLNYCLPVFGNVFGLDVYKDSGTRYTSYTKEDNRKLQVLQNSVMRLLTNKPKGTATITLLEDTGSLSIQQMIAAQTLVLVHKVLRSSKPAYLAARLQVRDEGEGGRVPARSAGQIRIPVKKLSITREGFIYRGTLLFNRLPPEFRTETKLEKFRTCTRKWVSRNILYKPA